MEFDELLQRADGGDKNSQYYVGKVYEDGVVIPQNYEKAIKYYDLAAKQGVFEAMLNTVYARNLVVKVKVTFRLKGYKNGRMVQDQKRFIIELKDDMDIPSYNTEEIFRVKSYFLKRAVISRSHGGVETEIELPKGKVISIEENTPNMQYKYTFEMVYSLRSSLLRDPTEDKVLLEIDHQELEKKIFALCAQKEGKELNPYRIGIAKIYWPMKKKVLKEEYDIEWKSPEELNNEGLVEVAMQENACEIDSEFWFTLI
ncbi:MAG: sel1 repeat family protein [Bacilli bacterium]|nr:sel1 repeat family protein [Bacilli bacterium]